MSDAFAIGQRVRVRRAFPPGHVRTPHYVRGRAGVIDAVAGRFGNPEELAYGRNGLPRETLYRVRFRLEELWPDDPGQGPDSAVVDLFEHWLEPAKDAPA
jgi:Nitrile hydratase beta subunit, C-terminal